MSARRWAAGLGGATVLALTAGCGMLGIGGGEEGGSDEERLLTMLNESYRIESELVTAENRIVQNCLEEQGFTVHEPYSFEDWGSYEQESLSEYAPHEEFLLDLEEAKEYGYGAWADTAEAQESGEAEDYWSHQEEQWADEEEEEWVEPDTTDWDALDPGEQYDWYVAYQGAEYAEYRNGTRDDYIAMMSEEELSEEEYEALEEDAAVEEEEIVEDEGEISVDEGFEDAEPKPGGCQFEMISALYGEANLVEKVFEEEEGTWSYWTYRPENQAFAEGEEDVMQENLTAEYVAAMGDMQNKYLDCVTERGYEGFAFDEYNSLPVRMYLSEIYYDGVPEDERMVSYGDTEVELPPLPEDMPEDYEAKKAYEIQMAVDFAECGDEVGYADASKKAYEEANIKAYEAVEDDYYAWQEEMEAALTKAQELIE